MLPLSSGKAQWPDFFSSFKISYFFLVARTFTPFPRPLSGRATNKGLFLRHPYNFIQLKFQIYKKYYTFCILFLICQIKKKNYIRYPVQNITSEIGFNRGRTDLTTYKRTQPTLGSALLLKRRTMHFIYHFKTSLKNM